MHSYLKPLGGPPPPPPPPQIIIKNFFKKGKKKKKKKSTSPFPGVKENVYLEARWLSGLCCVPGPCLLGLLTKGGPLGACRNKDGIGQRTFFEKAKNKRKIHFWEYKLLLELATSQHAASAPSRLSVHSRGDSVSASSSLTGTPRTLYAPGLHLGTSLD